MTDESITDSIQIEIDAQFEGRISSGFLLQVLRHVLAAETAPPGQVSVVVTDDESIRSLNNEFLGIDAPTDVLSFPSDDGQGDDSFVLPDEAEQELGDIYIALPVAERQAAEQGITVQEEVGHLLAHGALHLLGYDHIEPEEDAEMRAREESLLAELGIVVRHGEAKH